MQDQSFEDGFHYGAACESTRSILSHITGQHWWFALEDGVISLGAVPRRFNLKPDSLVKLQFELFNIIRQVNDETQATFVKHMED